MNEGPIMSERSKGSKMTERGDGVWETVLAAIVL